MTKIAFDYFTKDDRPLLHYLKFLVSLNPMFSVPFNIITIIEIFEKIKQLSPLIRKANGELSRKKIFFTRVGLLTIIFGLTLLSTDIAIIFDLVGALFGPILGFIIPVSHLPNTLRSTCMKAIIDHQEGLFQKLSYSFTECSILLD